MKNLIAALFFVLAAAADLPCSAAPAQTEARTLSASLREFSPREDLLMKQINDKALKQPDGGITAFVKVASGQSIRIETVDLDKITVSGPAKAKTVAPDPLFGLKTRGALAPAKSSKPKRHAIKKASAQLRAIQDFDQEWGEGKAKADAVVVERRKSR